MQEIHEVEGSLKVSRGITYLEFNFFPEDFDSPHPTVFYRVIREALMPLCPTLNMSITYLSSNDVGTLKCTIMQPCIDTKDMVMWEGLHQTLRSGVWLVKDDVIRAEVRNSSFFKRVYRAPSLSNSLMMVIESWLSKWRSWRNGH